MKLLELGLVPFGPFSSFKLDLSAPAGLHVVFGRNEAGKSTSLRAISGLLYGIPHDTLDAHQHPMPELRISGKLLGSDGRLLDVVRRKGRKNTLLTPAGQPLDEALLARALGGVGQDLYRTMFGLDHETLKAGAEALLRGKGDLGETLFDAGVGGAAVHDVLAELERQAAELYRPRATTAVINRELKELSEAKKRARQAATDPVAWDRQLAELEAAERELAEAEALRRELWIERDRLERIRRVLPRLRRRSELVAERAALGELRIDPELGRRRRELLDLCEKETWQIERLRGEIAAEESKRASHVFSERLARLPDEERVQVSQRLGAYQKNAKDLPKRRAELKGFEAEARQIAMRLGIEGPLANAERFQLDAPTQTRIRELVQRHALLEQALSDGRSELAEARAELERVRAELAAAPPPREVSELTAEVARAERAAELETRIGELQTETVRARRRADAAASAIGIECAHECVSALPIPAAESVDRFETRFAELERERARISGELATSAERERRCAAEARELGRHGEVPSAELLRRARAERDQAWQALERERSLEEARAFERLVARADQVADSLWQNAERVARAEAIAAELADLARDADALRASDAEVGRALAELEVEWRALWQPAGIAPRAPREMRAWLAGFARLIAAADALDERQAALDAAKQELERARAGVCRALGAEGSPELALAALLEKARARLSAEASRVREAEHLERVRRELERSEASRAARVAQREAELGAWQSEWEDAARALGEGQIPSPTETSARLDLIEALRRALERVADWRRRIDGMERDDRVLAEDVARLARELAPELADLPLERAGPALVREHEKTRMIESKLAEIDARLADKKDELARLDRSRELAERELGALVESAGVGSLAELADLEQRSERARALDRELAELDLALAEDRAGRPLEELESEARGVDSDLAKVRVAEIAEATEELQERLGNLHARVQSAKHGLERLGESTAVEAEEDAHAIAARAREHAERYVRVKLAATLLRREIDRYRERHQGPVVARASELFRRLTRGSFAALRADVDDADQPVLACVRQSGEKLQITGLSEGTREQLYLALRLASLEHFGEKNELLPLVLDDVLLHSDEDRTLAALELFGELGARMQILLFSHHAHLVELARRAVPPARLAVHELG